MSDSNFTPGEDEFVTRIERLLETRASEIDVMNRQESDRPRSEPNMLRLAPTKPNPRRQRYQYVAACAASVALLVAGVTIYRVSQPGTEESSSVSHARLVEDTTGKAADAVDRADETVVLPSPTTTILPPPTPQPPSTVAPPLPDDEPLPESSDLVGVPKADLRTVGGITVHVDVAPDLERMLAAANDDRIVLEGAGYRSPDAQIAIRRQNCGSTDYDIYEKPASECRPPTARPGISAHEKGTAVDLVVDGSPIRRDTEEYEWLAVHAENYGFINTHEGEPWHWEWESG